MKKILISMSVLLILGVGSAKAQISIGKGMPGDSPEFPQGLLHLFGKSYINDSTVRNVGFVIPKVDVVDSVMTPQGNDPVMGTLVFTVNDSVTDKQDLAVPGILRVRLKDEWSQELAEMSNIANFFEYDIYGGLNVRVKKVSAGYRYSLVIGWEDESVYSAGENSLGKTGLGSTSGTTATFKMLLAHRTSDISAGYQHALAVLKNGEVWSWGDGANRRTGQGNDINFTFPVRVKNIALAAGDTVIRCEAGYDNSLLLTQSGKVYCFGANRGGVNGTGTDAGNTTVPAQMNFGSNNIQDIALSSLSGAALDSAGQVYTWGNQYYGRLGNGGNTNTIAGITPITFPGKAAIKQVAMGTNHGLAVSTDGKHLYGWGAAQAWGGSTGTIAAVQTMPVDVTNFLVSGGFDPVNDTIVYIAATRFFSSGTPSHSNTSGGSIVITDKNVYAAGSNNMPERLGLGYFPKTMLIMYSPTPANGVRGTVITGFRPIYDKTIFKGTFFEQASIGVNHSLLKQTVVSTQLSDGSYSESGSYGYGMGNVQQNQLGAVSAGFSQFPVPSYIKK